MDMVLSRRPALVVSVDADQSIKSAVCEALKLARYSPDDVQGLADFTTFPTSGLYCWSGQATYIGQCQITGTPWFRWDGQWRLLVEAEVATVAMSVILQRGNLPSSLPATVPVRQVAAALWGVASKMNETEAATIAASMDEERRAMGQG
ncbi:MAG: hypothetical protein ACR2M1_05600, partial [Gemmatimonadaceae bacterium]